MGFYREQIFPRCVAWGMAGADITAQRPRCISRARGRVLEVGFGAGLNLPFYSGVSEVLALDPAAVNRKLARKRIAAASFPVRWIDLEGEEIPLESGSVDCVVSTFTLCTISDLPGALEEMKRVLVNGGRLLFLEHGLSPEERVARWQRRLNGLQRFWAAGCNLDRRIDDLVGKAGFEVEDLVADYMKGPKIFSYLYCGVGRKPGGL